MKKSRFFALLCAFIPGAGEMYMGLMKRGAAIMCVFGINIFLGIIIPPALIFLPVIWFYSFFDSLNLRNVTWEQLEELQRQDDHFFSDLFDQAKGGRLKQLFSKGHLLIGWAFVVCGVYVLYERFSSLLWNFAMSGDSMFMRMIARAMDTLPTFVVAFLLIFLGARLIRGKKVAAAPSREEEDFAPYHGGAARTQQGLPQDVPAQNGPKGE